MRSSFVAFNAHSHALAILFQMNAIGVDADVDSLRRKYLANDRRCILVFLAREPGLLFDYGDLAAKASETLGKLQPDISSADYNQVTAAAPPAQEWSYSSETVQCRHPAFPESVDARRH